MGKIDTINWSSNLEEYLKSISEKSMCLSILHKKSEKKYSNKAYYIDLPVIILSTLCGSASLSASSLFGKENEKISSTIIGCLSLTAGLLNTINSYFSYGRRAENHKNSYLEYNKLGRFISVQLGLPRMERITAKDLLKLVNDNYNRLLEMSSNIDDDLIKKFKKKYKEYKTLISFPDEVNGLTEIKINNDNFVDDYFMMKPPRRPLKKPINKKINNLVDLDKDKKIISEGNIEMSYITGYNGRYGNHGANPSGFHSRQTPYFKKTQEKLDKKVKESEKQVLQDNHPKDDKDTQEMKTKEMVATNGDKVEDTEMDSTLRK
jgi:hypothetical protein